MSRSRSEAAMHDVHVADVYLGKAPPRKSDPFEVWLSKRKAKVTR